MPHSEPTAAPLSLRSLPSVDALAGAAIGVEPEIPHRVAVGAAREAIAEARSGLRAGQEIDARKLHARVLELASGAGRPSLVPVINATGVILHTNLGRAPLSERAIAAMAAVGRGYSNLEFDLLEGRRGSRHDHARALIAEVTGAEDAIVLNNNAAALYMALHVLASPGEVIVSRGQAVEIGGGFRIPDVVGESGARIVEVGTTNRTYLRDYAAASNEATRAILRVHSSNFRVTGFTASASLPELADVAHERSVLLLDDLGSGALIDTAPFGMTHEPMVQESVAAGADLVLFSGDKLLGGPQCGIIAGRATLVAELRRHPLARALRVDKFTLAALNATLLAYSAGRATEEIPIWQMLSTPQALLRRRARRWAAVPGMNGALAPARSVVGGGSLPGEGVHTWAAALAPAAGVEQLNRFLRGFAPPIIGRIVDGRVVLDPRTVLPADDAIVRRALMSALEQS